MTCLSINFIIIYCLLIVVGYLLIICDIMCVMYSTCMINYDYNAHSTTTTIIINSQNYKLGIINGKTKNIPKNQAHKHGFCELNSKSPP